MAADSRGLGSAAYFSPPSYSSSSHQPSSVSSLHGRSAMSSSMSPDPGPSSSYGGAPSGSQDKGGLSSVNLGFLKNLTEKRTTRGTSTGTTYAVCEGAALCDRQFGLTS
jgi:hypothetical protein